MLALGWRPHNHFTHCNLIWRAANFTATEHSSVMPWQRLNHFRGASSITRKDKLCRTLRTMRAIHGAIFDIFPETFLLPTEFANFAKRVANVSDTHSTITNWIFKPADSSRGRGIFLFDDIHSLKYDCSGVVQSYIENPLLMDGYKFDLRIYVVVTSVSPLTAYVSREGLVRRSSARYDKANLENLCAHLTNTAVNMSGAPAASCKWSFGQLRTFFSSRRIADQPVWSRINELVMLTLLAWASTLEDPAPQRQCFELFGFDVMVDENLRPWLIEVNSSPQLNIDAAVDRDVKGALIKSIVELINFHPSDSARVESTVEYASASDSSDSSDSDGDERGGISQSTTAKKSSRATSSISRSGFQSARALSSSVPRLFTGAVFQTRMKGPGKDFASSSVRWNSLPSITTATTLPALSARAQASPPACVPHKKKEAPPPVRRSRQLIPAIPPSSLGSLPRGNEAPLRVGCLVRVLPAAGCLVESGARRSSQIKDAVALIKAARSPKSTVVVVADLFEG
eukprot:m.297739 g.297739  ORF g.297739 m.297739 type:complete len:513 (-) comp55170_c0_seq2:49-1587(-)